MRGAVASPTPANHGKNAKSPIANMVIGDFVCVMRAGATLPFATYGKISLSAKFVRMLVEPHSILINSCAAFLRYASLSMCMQPSI